MVVNLQPEQVDHGVIFMPIVRFKTDSGQLIYFRDFGFAPPFRNVGDRVTVLYDQRNPKTAIVKSYYAFVDPLFWLALAIVVIWTIS